MSPIKSITNIYRPQRQGKIHLGVKGKKKKDGCPDIEYPVEVDYFVLSDAPELVAIYGDKPKELHITLPSSRFEKGFDAYLEKVFPQYLKRYRKAGLMCRGDGVVASCVNPETGTLDEQPCPCEFLEKGDCKRIGLFRFRVHEEPSLNYYQITTSSFNSIVNINSFIRDLAEFCAVWSIDISSVKLVLTRKEQDVQRLEKGESKKSRHHIMMVDLDRRFYKSLDEVKPRALPISQAKTEALPPADESRDPLYFPEERTEGPAKEDPSGDDPEGASIEKALAESRAAQVKLDADFEREKKREGIRPDAGDDKVKGAKAGTCTVDDLPEGEINVATIDQVAAIATLSATIKGRGKSEKTISEELCRVLKKKHGVDLGQKKEMTVEEAGTCVAFLKGWLINIDQKRKAAKE